MNLEPGKTYSLCGKEKNLFVGMVTFLLLGVSLLAGMGKSDHAERGRR